MKFTIKFFKKILCRRYYNSNDYIRYLKKSGIKIGSNCAFYDCNHVEIDMQNPWMLSIGNNVRITSGVQILTHDYSFSVLCSVAGDVVGSVEKTIIGNNIFIGRNAIILKGVQIADNVIIGAGSIVSRDCESNSVYAGNPAKRICSIEEMYKKRKDKMLYNAKQVATCYYERFGKTPKPIVLREYQMIFDSRNNIPDSLNELMKDSGYYEKCVNYYRMSSPYFANFDDFLKWCGLPVGGELSEEK